MNEKQTSDGQIRPTKKQLALLKFIEDFIAEHGYSPSYREVMSGMNYTSVATVALHINSLISRGHLIKRGRSARSLELAEPTGEPKLATNEVKAGEEKWLVEKVDYFFVRIEQGTNTSESDVENLEVLIHTLRILGLDGAAQSFATRLGDLKQT